MSVTDHTFSYHEENPIIAFDKNEEGVDLKINTSDTLLFISLTKKSFNRLAVAAYETLESGRSTCFNGNKFIWGEGEEREETPAKKKLGGL